MTSTADCVVTYTYRCHVCNKIDEALLKVLAGDEIRNPGLPEGWRSIPNIGNVCPDHSIKIQILVDGKPYGPKS